MKTTFLLTFAILICISCNNAENSITNSSADSTSESKVSLPYTTAETPSWDWGSEGNIAIAMNALKGFETGNIDGTRQFFADSVEFEGDYWHFKGTSDSLMQEFKKYRSNYTTYNIVMEDYESVKNKGNGAEYVSLWYREQFTDNKGKADSVYVMDDIRLIDGKIVSIDSKLRHYPTSAPK